MRVSFGQLDIECKGYGEITPQSGWFIGPHAHECYEVHFVTEGRGVNELSNGTLDLYPGIVYVAPPGEIHAQWVDEAHPMGLYFLLFHMTYPNAGLHSRIYSRLPVITRKAQAVFKLEQQGGPGDRFRSQLRIVELIWQIVDPAVLQCGEAYTSGTVASAADRTVFMPNVVDQAIHYIHAHLPDSMAVDEIALACHVSARHLSRIFYSYLGMSVHGYVENERFQWAAEELKKGALRVREISDQMNFSSPQYFSQWFKQHAHMRPSQFRGADDRR